MFSSFIIYICPLQFIIYVHFFNNLFLNFFCLAKFVARRSQEKPKWPKRLKISTVVLKKIVRIALRAGLNGAQVYVSHQQNHQQNNLSRSFPNTLSDVDDLVLSPPRLISAQQEALVPPLIPGLAPP